MLELGNPNTFPHQADALWQILDAASQKAPNYNAAENHKRWGRYIDEALDHETPTTIATVFKVAQDHGWQGLPAQPVTSLGNLLPVGQSPVTGTGVSFANVPHRQWLYGMDLVRGEITILASPGGVGKSSLAVGIAISIATSRRLLDEKLYGDELTALYINAEDSIVEMTRRIWAFCQKHGVAEQDISRLHLLGTDSHQVQRLSFLRTEGRTSKLDEGGVAVFENLLNELRPGALMAVPMAEDEANKLGVLPSERQSYLKVVPSKSNLAPRSADLPWYQLCNVTLPNSEPPIYLHGDSVQAIERVTLPKVSSASTVETLRIKRAILDVADAGKIIDGQVVPYSPGQTGASNQRSILEDAMVAVEQVTGRPWNKADLRAVVQRTLDDLRGAGWMVTEKIKEGRFRRTNGLRVDWQQTPWAGERSQGDTAGKVADPTDATTSNQQSADSAEVGNGQSGAIAQGTNSPMTNAGVVVNCPPFKGALIPHHPETAEPPHETCNNDEGNSNADT